MALLQRRPLRSWIVVFTLTICWLFVWYEWKPSFIARRPPSSSASGRTAVRLPHGLKGDRVVIYEQGIHDEVVGALAYTLREGGLDPLVIASFRFGFVDVIQAMHPETNPRTEPYQIESPYGSNATILKRLEADSIDYLILSTCSSSLPHLGDAVTKSNAHVVCVVHHSGAELYHKHRAYWKPLAEQGRLTLVTLGHHVAVEVTKDIEIWAEIEESTIWENLRTEVLLPVFNYTPQVDREPPVIFPSSAVVQGNIESGRRNYKKLFLGLEGALNRNASLWGYKPLVPGRPAEPLMEPNASPFTLHLLGQIPKDSDLHIPVELETMIRIHPGLQYPDFYKAIAECVSGTLLISLWCQGDDHRELTSAFQDVVLPAFAQNGPYFETTSSSVAASVIARVPLIGTRKLARSYSYLDETAILPRSLSETEVMAIERMRLATSTGSTQGNTMKGTSTRWKALHDKILASNLQTWHRILT